MLNHYDLQYAHRPGALMLLPFLTIDHFTADVCTSIFEKVSPKPVRALCRVSGALLRSRVFCDLVLFLRRLFNLTQFRNGR